MDLELLAVIGVIAVALVFDFTNGFHDAANSVSTIVATGVLKPRWAVLWAAVFNFVAFLVFGTAVANTVAATVKPEASGIGVIFSALLGAIVWNYLTWWLGLPSSSSHALVGGLTGAGIAAGGINAIEWSSVGKTLLFIVLSPVAGLVAAGLVGLIVHLFQSRTGRSGSERGFAALQLLSSAGVSLGHGANDAQKTMGVIAALLVTTGHLNGGDTLEIPLWVVLSAHTAIAIGTLSGGWQIVRTMGLGITALRPATGFAAEAGAAAALFTSTALGAPVSTTHTVAGAVTGVGVVTRQRVQWSVMGRVMIAWGATIPAAGLMSAAAYGLTRLPRPATATALAVLGVLLVVLLVLALRNSTSASDLEREASGARAAAAGVGAAGG